MEVNMSDIYDENKESKDLEGEKPTEERQAEIILKVFSQALRPDHRRRTRRFQAFLW